MAMAMGMGVGAGGIRGVVRMVGMGVGAGRKMRKGGGKQIWVLARRWEELGSDGVRWDEG